MKSIISNLLVATLFAYLSVQNVSCLRCYECDPSFFDSSACDEVSPRMITQCPDSDDAVCIKGEFRIGDDIYRRVKRSCLILPSKEKKDLDETGKIKRSFLGIAMEINVCETELCNGAVGISPTKMILFVSAVLSLYFSCMYTDKS